ncbi:MAG: potassium channel family protein [Gammaproteobacteria bacterium]
MRRVGQHTRFKRFIRDISVHTPFIKLLILMVVLWLIFSTGMYLAERNIEQAGITTFGKALYWCVAAFSTAGIADTPLSATGQLVGGLWIVIGSVLFFGTIIATITSYFMRPMQRPHKKIIDTIEYNLEQLEDLSVDELDLLKNTIDTLIEHVETLKQKHNRE